MNNYLVSGGNPLDLKGPPEWWLKKLHEFDDSLVVIPSRLGYFYRLAQRRAPDPKAILAHNIQGDHDSQTLARFNLIPVTTIIATARWDNPLMWNDLASRMPSRNGGAEAYEAKLLTIERQKELDELAKRDDMLDIIAKDSKKFYDLKRGVRSNLWSPSIKGSNRLAANRSAAIRIVNANNSKAIITKF